MGHFSEVMVIILNVKQNTIFFFSLLKNQLKDDIVERNFLIFCIYFDAPSWKMIDVTWALNIGTVI